MLESVDDLTSEYAFMNAVDTLSKAEDMISGLSNADKAQLLKWLELEVSNDSPGVERSDGVMGSAACIRQTRIPVWLLEQARRQGVSEAELLRNYPQLTAADLINTWKYFDRHRAEIEQAILANEADD